MTDSTSDRSRKPRPGRPSQGRKAAAPRGEEGRPAQTARAPRSKRPPAPGRKSAAAARFVEEPFLAELRAAVDLVERSAAEAASLPAPRAARAAPLARPQPDGSEPDLTRPGQPRPDLSGPAQPPATRVPLDEAASTLVDVVKRRFPDVVPRAPLETGAVASAIAVESRDVGTLVAIAARQAVLAGSGGAVPDDPARLPQVVLWEEGPDALLVEVGQIAVEVGEGLISVAVPVRCDQLPQGRAVVTVDLVLGTPDRPTGLLAATTEPRGPQVVVRRWGEALTALAWQAVLDAAGGVAGAAGVDRDGSVLVPAALTPTRQGLAVLPRARLEIDRVRPGQVVLGTLAGTTGTARP